MIVMPLAILDFLHITLTDILDILMVAAIIFLLFRWLRGSSAMNVFIAVIFLYVVKVVVSALNMTLMSGIMSTVLDVGVIALIIIFQPEIRYFLIKLGSRYGLGGSGWKIFDRLFGRKGDRLGSESLDQILDAVADMSAQKTGALIVIMQNETLEEYERTGIRLDAQVSSQLLINIFEHNTPLHDGAVTIRGDRITAATCYLPLSDNMDLSKELGTRHRAGVGISEVTDSFTIIVSEETGYISTAYRGNLRRNVTPDELKDQLVQLQNKSVTSRKFKLWKRSEKAISQGGQGDE